MPTSAIEATRAEALCEAKRESWGDGDFAENVANDKAILEQLRNAREPHEKRFMKPGGKPSPIAVLNRFLKKRYGHIRFRLLDFCCLGYMALIGLLLPFFHRQVPHWPSDFLIHVLFVIAGLEIIRFAEKRPQNKLLWAIRTFYPVAFYGYGYGEIDHTVRMFFGSYWAIDFLLNLDKAIFGVHPTIWVQQFYSPWLDELMNFFYAGYYLFPALIALPLFLRKKSEETLAAFSILTFVYFTNFLLFYVFPTLSPRHIPGFAEMHSNDYTGYFIASFNRFVQSFGSVHGGCFPSSHVSGALAWSLVAWRYDRKLGYLFFPMALGVAVATVYLRYHHAVDPIAGLIWGFVCYHVALAILKKRGEDPVNESRRHHGKTRLGKGSFQHRQLLKPENTEILSEKFFSCKYNSFFVP